MADPSAGYAQAYSDGRHSVGLCLDDMDDRQFDDWTRLLEQRMGLFIAPERRSFWSVVSGPEFAQQVAVVRVSILISWPVAAPFRRVNGRC